MESSTAAKLYRVGGVSGIAIGATQTWRSPASISPLGLYPQGWMGPQWLAYLADHMTVWWGIIVLSVVTDALYVPVAVALVMALSLPRSIAAMTGRRCSFCSSSWILASLDELRALMRLASAQAGTMAAAAAATYAAAVLDSALFAVYAILVPSLGILCSASPWSANSAA